VPPRSDIRIVHFLQHGPTDLHLLSQFEEDALADTSYSPLMMWGVWRQKGVNHRRRSRRARLAREIR